MSEQKKIFRPTHCFNDWRDFLADPEKQWKQGYSAYEIAHSWEFANGIPMEIRKALVSSSTKNLHEADLLFAVPEFKVPLPGGSRASQADVFSVLTTPTGLVTMLVEGKARENFDVELGVWKKRTSEEGKRKRLQAIAQELGLLQSEIPDSIRYQLLHRTASAVIMAKLYHARCALMLVQSFESAIEKNHYEDYRAFGILLGKTLNVNEIEEVKEIDGIKLCLGWVISKPTIMI